MSLFMAFGKRRGEPTNEYGTKNTRKFLENMRLDFLAAYFLWCAGLAIVFILYGQCRKELN